ncbi:hypothetical protein [Carboxylicivirga linearis]|uniref:Uncharacterized protein n=1 Tax=Carboxylicivirga linearis TaxID=1628157 RepID=A0ABS5JQD7_9BACT|nr:hypothetical protein [Carboxylicivirga linearis]MBS2097040.1 hypothetical protein [Carboxylicivirga linearis]
MKETNPTIQDIKAIRQMMEDSSKFLSLSGLSGVAAGLTAIIGAAIAYYFVLDKGTIIYDERMVDLYSNNTLSIRLGLFTTAVVVFIVAVTLAWWLSYRKAKKAKVSFWTHTAKKVMWSMVSTLTVGGLFSLILIYHENIRLVASVMLIFYGLALIMASRYTQRDIQYLGYTEILLGLAAGLFLNFGLIFWTLGFGVFHIIYGIVMYLKYDR